jgi:hypothetical protein
MADLLTLIGIPDGLTISGGRFEVKRAVQRSAVLARYTPSEWSANRKVAGKAVIWEIASGGR